MEVILAILELRIKKIIQFCPSVRVTYFCSSAVNQCNFTRKTWLQRTTFYSCYIPFSFGKVRLTICGNKHH